MNDETRLLRQVHPSFIADGFVSSQAFTPFPKDAGLLSVYDGDLISAEDAYLHYTQTLHFQSVGVWAVTNAEAEEVGLSSRPDPLEDFAQHAVIDFTAHSPKTIRKLAKQLRDFAAKRGCLFAPTSA